MAVGEPVVSGRLDTGAAPGTLPAATAAVGVPLGATTPQLEVGDTVDIHATFDPAPGLAPSTSVVAERARVLALEDRIATMAIAVDEIEAVTSALALASMTVVIRDR